MATEEQAPSARRRLSLLVAVPIAAAAAYFLITALIGWQQTAQVEAFVKRVLREDAGRAMPALHASADNVDWMGLHKAATSPSLDREQWMTRLNTLNRERKHPLREELNHYLREENRLFEDERELRFALDVDLKDWRTKIADNRAEAKKVAAISPDYAEMLREQADSMEEEHDNRVIEAQKFAGRMHETLEKLYAEEPKIAAEAKKRGIDYPLQFANFKDHYEHLISGVLAFTTLKPRKDNDVKKAPPGKQSPPG